jgi:tetratricopeptide (TPR) repeat protein
VTRRVAPPPAPGRRSSARDGPADLLRKAVRLHQAGDLDQAATLYQRVLKGNPRQPDALHLLGVVRHQQGDHRRALDLIAGALAEVGDNAAFRNSLGSVLLALGRLDEAEAALRQAIAAAPANAQAHNNLGNVLMRRGRPADAVALYERAITLNPGYAEAQSNLGSAKHRLGRLDDAERALREALALSPRHTPALANLGLVLHDRARYADALAAYDQALALDPHHATARANRAVLLLLLGRFEEGWRDYEGRWRVAGFTTRRRSFAAPPWTGRPSDDLTVFIHAEQGLGSAIQFVRYAPLVAAGCRQVIVECQPPLERLFRQSLEAGAGGSVRVVTRGGDLPAFDAHAAMMSLPGLSGTTLATVPAAVPYLKAAEDDRERWHARLAGDGRPRVGLVWAGNPNHLNDHNRSMPASALAPLVAAGHGTFYALQVGPARDTVAELPAGRAVDLAPELDDFADTAAALQALDLVISVDTAVAHLAGALARPVWLLLPHVPEWRWLLDRADTPWYPTMRVFRQQTAGDWAGVVERVTAALAAEWR